MVFKVVQKAFTNVNEEGSEAAAASAMMITARGGGYARLRFTCDKPFMFIIKDGMSRLVLFAGRVENPTKIVEISLVFCSFQFFCNDYVPIKKMPNLCPTPF